MSRHFSSLYEICWKGERARETLHIYFDHHSSPYANSYCGLNRLFCSHNFLIFIHVFCCCWCCCRRCCFCHCQQDRCRKHSSVYYIHIHVICIQAFTLSYDNKKAYSKWYTQNHTVFYLSFNLFYLFLSSIQTYVAHMCLINQVNGI